MKSRNKRKKNNSAGEEISAVLKLLGFIVLLEITLILAKLLHLIIPELPKGLVLIVSVTLAVGILIILAQIYDYFME